MRWVAVLALAPLVGCVDKLDDTGVVESCCTFSCDDGTTGEVSFTVDAADCDAYAENQCAANGAAVSSAAYQDVACP